MWKIEKSDDEYGDHRNHLARRPHDIWSAWALTAMFGLGVVLAMGAGSQHGGKVVPKTFAASDSSEPMPLAEQIGMSLERVR